MRKPKVRARSELPEWMERYLATGEEPQPDHPDYADFMNWYLIPGWAEFTGKNWPDPPG